MSKISYFAPLLLLFTFLLTGSKSFPQHDIKNKKPLHLVKITAFMESYRLNINKISTPVFHDDHVVNVVSGLFVAYIDMPATGDSKILKLGVVIE